MKKDTRAFSSIYTNSYKDCQFCVSGNNNILGSLFYQNFPKDGSLQYLVKKNLDSKYLTTREYYNSKIITDIVYNENSNIVSVFKDYLILDDISEFLKRMYAKYESVERLPKVIDFYEKYSKVFPNYITLPENKIMFKNIERKQRYIDEKQRIAQKIQKQKEERQIKKMGYKKPQDYSIDLFNRLA